ncbi:MAG: 4-phosphopantoate--beta-alanine ligase, partial [Planctomycetota bacterium]
PDGLAMSSRNRYLKGDERVAATRIYAALDQARREIAAGVIDVARLEAAMRRTIMTPGVTAIDYASVVDAETLQPVERVERRVLIAAAVRIGAARLIDNVQVDPPATAE